MRGGASSPRMPAGFGHASTSRRDGGLFSSALVQVAGRVFRWGWTTRAAILESPPVRAGGGSFFRQDATGFADAFAASRRERARMLSSSTANEKPIAP
jgi:hypothetical protein